MIIGYDEAADHYYIDRRQSGEGSFSKDFAGKHVSPRLSNNKGIKLTLVVDDSSVELFADGGSTAMTSIFFPDKPYNKIHLQSINGLVIKELTYTSLKSIWNK